MAISSRFRRTEFGRLVTKRKVPVAGNPRSCRVLPRVLRIEELEVRSLLSGLAWSAGVSLPAPVTAAPAVSYNGATYLFGGASGTRTPTTVYQFTPGALAWTTAASIDQGRAGGGVGLAGYVGFPANFDSATSDIFNFGGANGGQPTNTAFNYNGDFNPASMSTARAYFGYVTDPPYPAGLDYQFSHSIYAIGGLNASQQAVASVERFSLASNTWTAVAPLPQAISNTTAADDGAGHLFVFGGKDAAGQPLATVYRYTIATDTWDTAAPMPVALSDASAVYAAYGEIFVVGGRNSSGQAVASVENFNPVLNTWSATGPLPLAVYDAGAAIDGNGNLQVIGGTNLAGQAVANVWTTPVGPAPTGLPAVPEVTVDAAYYSYDATAHAATAAAVGSDGVTPVAGTFSFLYNGSAVTPVDAGTYQVTALFTSADPSYVSVYAVGQLVIEPAAPSLTVSGGGTFLYDAQSHGITATVVGVDGTTPVNGSITYSYNSAATPPVAPGSYTAVATFTSSDPNYADSSATTTVTIPDPTIPTGVTVTGVSTTSLQVSWNAAWEADATASPATSYNVYEKLWHKGTHSPRGSGGTPGYYYYVAVATGVTTTSVTISGLSAASNSSGGHTYVVSSVDASGTISAYSAAASGQPLYATVFGYTLVGGALADSTTVEVGQTSNNVTIKFYGNPIPTMSIVSGPPTMSIDPVTGIVTYTPAASDVGAVKPTAITAVFQATNGLGPALTASFTYNVIARPTVVVSGGTFIFDGTTHSATAVAYAADGVTPIAGTFSFQYAPIQYPTSFSSAPYAEPGTYTAEAIFTSSDPGYGGATGFGTVVISPATPTIVISAGPFAYDGQPHAATAQAFGYDGVTPVAGDFQITYDGSPTAPTSPGVYQVQASFTVAPLPYTTIVEYTSATATASMVIFTNMTVASGPIPGGLQGPVRLTIAGPGVATLGGQNTYQGGTVVQGGTLVVNGADALPTGGSLTVGADVAAFFTASPAGTAGPMLISTVQPAAVTAAQPAPAATNSRPLPAIAMVPASVSAQIRDQAILAFITAGRRPALIALDPVAGNAGDSDLPSDSLSVRGDEVRLLNQFAAVQ
jgi:autotransporter-associated beta strand protein